ncbi:efflux RND transporter periplasmic adaptor subunit [Rhizobacter sp. AJA081-3]|uniref:efflux RND transporter periplasmic adaptor subunit n=1 Tax=Rhizobacter sp. AJA081-3 TaxID=2753607 RepID=UPI001AE0E587|nr:efflux RND transporter periplasmic adaptor subunit [Rhizobacter sp. AJA081-3]QTN25030.1 efflux RND transporter periplasmic adaptor subunit [Rhizobacter sp. AJA081-3]
MKILHTVIAVVGIAAASGAAWWIQNKGAGSGSQPAVSPSAAAASAAGAGPAIGGPIPVEVGRVTVTRIEDDAQSVGSLRSRQGVMLRPEVSGRIARIGFRDGQRVKRGQMLVQLDDTLQRAQLQQSQAQASIARTNLQRNRELLAQNFVSASAVDQSAAALEVTEAQVALSQAQLARMRIEAPFDGVAGIASVNLGDYVKDGADLVNIEDSSSMSVDFRLPERYLARLKPGQPVDVQLDALPGRSFPARIDAIDSQIDANGRSLLVRARLPNPQGELRAGMFARTRTVFAVREQALVVPEEALVPFGGKQYLIKVVDGPGGKVSQRLEARIGMRLPGKAEITEGLAAGDLVVTAGQARLLRGEALPLRVVEVGREAPRGASSPAKGAGLNRSAV